MALDLQKLDQEKDPTKLLQMLKNWEDEETTRYQPVHREWEKNMLFFLGKQWLEQKKGSDGFFILEDDDDHYRPVDNQVARLCILKQSHILGKGVRAAVKTNSEKHDDIKNALLADLLLRAVHQKSKGDDLDTLTFLHGQIFGIAYRTNYKQPRENFYIKKPIENLVRTEFFQCQDCGGIDENKSTCPHCGSTNTEFKREESMEAEMDPQTGEQKFDQIPIYDAVEKSVDPFRIKVSESTNEEELKWINETTLQDVSWIKEAFNKAGSGFKGYEATKRVKKDDAIPRGLKLSMDFAAMVAQTHSSISSDVSGDGSKKSENKDQCVFHRSSFKPSKNHPYGRLIMWTKTAVLYDGVPDVPKIYQRKDEKCERWHSLTWFMYYVHPLRFEGIPYVENLIPINKKINSLEAMILEHLDKTAIPDKISFGNVQKNNDDNSEGEIVIDPMPNLPNGGAPTYLQHPTMNNEVYRLKERYIAEIEKKANVTEVMQGYHPAGLETFRGLQLLRESADSSEAGLFKRWHNFKKETAELRLKVLQECLLNQDAYLVELMKKLRDNENLTDEDVVNFSVEDLTPNINIVLEEQDYLGQSRAAQQEQVAAFLEAQILTPEDVADPVMKIHLMRKLGQPQLPFADKADIEKAERMIKLMESQDYMRVQQMTKHFDNKGIQLRVITDWAKSPHFEELHPQIQVFAEQLLKRLENELLQSVQTPNPEDSGGPVGAGPTGNPPMLQ